MKFQVEQHQISACLSRMVAITETRNTIPILGNVLIEAVADAISITATDLDISIKEVIAARVDVQGATTVSARTIKEIIAKLESGSLVSFEEGEGIVKVKAGRSSFKLNTLPPEDFPVLAGDTYDSVIEFASGTLKSAIDRTEWASSKEETRYYLKGVAMQHKDGKAVFVATDGHRLARYVGEETNDFPDIIVPSKTVKQWSNVIGDSDVVLSISPTKTKLDTGNIVIVSKNIDGVYPDWTRVIPVGYGDAVTCSSMELSKAIERVSVIASERTKAVKIVIASDEIKLTVIDSTYGNAEDTVEAQQSGSDVEIGVNGKYALEAMKQAEKGVVSIGYKTDMDPMLVTYDKEPNLICVVMPQRV